MASSSSSAVQCAPTASAFDSSSSSDSNPTPPLPTGTVVLRQGDAIEFWHAKGLALGNYEGPVTGRLSLAVRTEAGEPLVIDAGQIVGAWREGEMRGAAPTDSAGWAELREQARELLQGMPARGLDLGPFWRAASSREKGFVVTPAHAAEFLFGETQSNLGLKKRRPFQFRGWVSGFGRFPETVADVFGRTGVHVLVLLEHMVVYTCTGLYNVVGKITTGCRGSSLSVEVTVSRWCG